MITLEFTKHYTPYAKGDVATFTEEEAEKYIEAEVAHEYTGEKPGKKGGKKTESKDVEGPDETK